MKRFHVHLSVSDLEQSMAQLDLVLRETRRSLDVLTYGAMAGAQV